MVCFVQRPLLILVSGLTLVLITTASKTPAAEIQFARDIRPILSDNCFACHGPNSESRDADLRLDDQEAVLDDRDGEPVVKAGDPDASSLWHRVTSTADDEVMPPADSNKKLTPEQIELIRQWIEQGAQWQGHWAFIAPQKPQPPEAPEQVTVHNPIDAFVAARLAEVDLKPSPEASRETLIRRLSFDLTGLPPTLAQIDAFVSDQSSNAYENLVDRLLASEHYGERMAIEWLDAARYGDTSVFHADGPRDMWGWRDWVIRSYNDNMPFDQFTVWQLGGDLLPNPTVEQRVATAFNRNHATTDEGGAIAEEYRVEYVVDRVKTTSTVWLGMTMECAQCHEHKYDPVSHKEYYQFYAFFNQTTDTGMQTRGGNAAPTVAIPQPGIEADVTLHTGAASRLKKQIDEHIEAVKPKIAELKADSADDTAKLPADPLAYFSLDEMKGDRVNDAVAPDRESKIHGKPQWVEGKSGSALRTDKNTYADLGDVANFKRDEQFSYGGWIYVENNAASAAISRMDEGNAFRGWDLFLAGGKVSVHLVNRWPDNAIKVTTEKSVVKAKQWHHVLVTYDGSSKASGVKIYVNGKSQPWAIEQDGLSETIQTDKPLLLGRRSKSAQFTGRIDDVRLFARTLSESDATTLASVDPAVSIFAVAPDARSPEQVKTLQAYYLNTIDEQYPPLKKELDDHEKQLAELKKPLTTVMVMGEMPEPRKTYLLKRGHYASPDKSEVIAPGLPAFLLPLPEGSKNDRLGLARWLTDPQHPLVARVTVNRFWQMIFGTGLVETLEDFGSQGAWPSHPRLLDWLAVDFVENGWDMKRTIKQMVMSATYRQSAKITPELLQKDPLNRLLSRGPRFRLKGEFVRDNALAISQSLVPKVGGPGVKPYQPAGLWNEVSLSGNVRFVQDHGEKLYRRSMYTYWKRSSPAPSMRIFDAPTREKCAVRRQRTNTPLQAFVTLNDPQFIESARLLARRMMIEGGQTPESRVAFAYRLATAQRPGKVALGVLVRAHEQELAEFRKDAKRAEALLGVGETKRDMSLDTADHAAWTIVASMILNLDECLTKG